MAKKALISTVEPRESGSGTVSVGTALKTYDVSLGIPGTTPIATSNVFLDVISGSDN